VAQAKVPSEVARRLMREVADRGLVPGDNIGSESWLIERYGVARGSLREAMRLLEAQGAVEMRRGTGGGAMVSLPRPELLAGSLAMTLQAGHGDMRTILEARAAVEPTMAALAAERRTDIQLRALRACVADLLSNRSDSDRFHHENRRFHNLVAEASGNLLLAAILPALSLMSQAAGWQLHEKVRRRIASDKERIVDAIEERHSWRASQRMSRMILGYEELDKSDPDRFRPVIWADVDELLESYRNGHDNEQ
jgi:GntR family transcriptional repressor for pyruvate dehydrogenase complex